MKTSKLTCMQCIYCELLGNHSFYCNFHLQQFKIHFCEYRCSLFQKQKTNTSVLPFLTPIKGYNNFYFVDKMGNVYSCRTSIFKKMTSTYVKSRNHLIVTLINSDGKPTKKRVHYLVATTFIQNPLRLKFILFLDRDTKNCNVNNLKWASKKEYSLFNNQ